MRKPAVPSSTLLLAILSPLFLSACDGGDTRRSETVDHAPLPAIAAATTSAMPAAAATSITLPTSVSAAGAATGTILPMTPAATLPVAAAGLSGAGVAKPAPLAESNPGAPMPTKTAETPPPLALVVTPPRPAPSTTPPSVVLPPPAPKPAPVTASPPPPISTAPAPPPPKSLDKPPAFDVITDVTLESTKGSEQVRVPVTFGQVFAPGQVGSAHTINAKLADGSVLPLQVDAKARHADGSLRHAILSTTLPRLTASSSQKVFLTLASQSSAAPQTTPAALLDAGFSANVSIELDGTRYTASAEKLLQSGRYQVWLAGPVANEWLVSAPLATAQGVPHPHLTARFAVRAFGSKQARVDVIIENNWAFEDGPSNFTYDAKVNIGGKVSYSKEGLTHYHHARWRKVFWWGGEPEVHVRHNVAYLLDSRALPNFDRKIVPNAGRITTWKAGWSGAKTEPMGVGLAVKYMPATGGRDDIGLLPAWAAIYLLSMDERAKELTLDTASLAGSWSSHYRDKATDRPVTLSDYPYMTVYGHRPDTFNPATKKHDAFPLCATKSDCATPYVHDSSHQPAFAYLPYMVTGDHYYLEELQFWAMWNAFNTNPGYREFAKGLLKSDQVRAQAWSLRTIGEAGYITPDTDPLKAEFKRIVNANLDWYNSSYTDNPAANKLGVLTYGYATAYGLGTGVAPWMDDFFTSAIGHLAEMGYPKAKPLLAWKTKFPVERMLDPGACWINASSYALIVRKTSVSPFFETMGDVWKATHGAQLGGFACNSTQMAASLKLRVGEMVGYAGGHSGYPSNMQPALAYAVDVTPSRGTTAWNKFMARSVKPDYSHGPQFAIIPR